MVIRSSEVCEISCVWWLERSTPLFLMKLSRWGICSRSEGTRVEPSRAGSRTRCVLSKMMVTTCWIFPRAELSWQPPAAGLADGGTGGAAAFAVAPAEPAGAAHAGTTGYKARSTAVPRARAPRHQLAQALLGDPSLLLGAELGCDFTSTSW